MANYNGIGKDLIKGGIFERFPELIPKGGENYWQGEHSKLLVVGESNYFEDDMESKSDFKVAEKWYHGIDCCLIPKEMTKNVNNWKSGRGFNNLFKSMKKVLEEEGINDFKADLINEITYYNYFLRPACVKKSNRGFEKDCEPIDCEVSYSALCGIIEEIKPNIVIFVSKFSHGEFMESYIKEEKHFENVVIDYVNHFAQACWYDANGQQKFENLLREHWVNKNPMNESVFKKLQAIHSKLKEKFNVEKEQECFSESGSYLSCLYFKVNEDFSFCCETGVKINYVDFWTCFYKTENSKEIPSLEEKKYQFKPTHSDDEIISKIEKLINQIFEEIG